MWLRDVLAKVGVDGNTELRHVHTEGLDQPYGASIPMEKAISPTGDVMLGVFPHLQTEHPSMLICGSFSSEFS